MRKLLREPEPEVLKNKGASWTESWRSRKSADRSAQFVWPQYENQRLNHLLLPALRRQTQDHCSFCDGYPVETVSDDTIEHFHPKSDVRFLDSAFSWDNLFYACSKCQRSKAEKFEEALLKPDGADYCFSDFFIWDFSTGRLEPNPRAASAAQQRATVTIGMFGLNDHGRPTARRVQRRRWLRISPHEEINDWPYRDFIAGPTAHDELHAA